MSLLQDKEEWKDKAARHKRAMEKFYATLGVGLIVACGYFLWLMTRVC